LNEVMAAAIEVRGGDHEHVLDFAAPDDSGPAFRYERMASGALAGVVLGGTPFDVCEFSLANHIMLHATGARRLAAIPVFPSRAFRNAALYVASDSPLESPAELAGKRIGVSEFAMTPAIWARGHFHDDHGLDWRDVEWVVGPNPRFPTPDGIRTVPGEGDLEAMLATGTIDALLAGKPKDAGRPPAERQLRCLIPFPAAQERAYFDATGIFPILHTVVLHERHDGDTALPRRLFDAYVSARHAAIARKISAGFLPFGERDWEVLVGPHGDPTRYGLTPANRAAIATLSRYLREQGFIAHEPAIDDLFLPGSASWTDN
jgi:4,5-dihydroxyphthalate decarboxylase